VLVLPYITVGVKVGWRGVSNRLEKMGWSAINISGDEIKVVCLIGGSSFVLAKWDTKGTESLLRKIHFLLYYFL